MSRVATPGESRNGGRIVNIRAHDSGGPSAISGMAAGVLAIIGMATGIVAAPGAISGAAAGTMQIVGSAAGSVSVPAISGSASGAMSITGQATGITSAPGSVSGAAAGTMQIAGAAVGSVTPPAINGSASGSMVITGQATATYIETHVFVLIGQSNMVGRADFDGLGDYTTGILQYNQSGALVQATSPIDHFDELAGDMGLSITFANGYQTANPNAKVVLVPCAKGGSGFGSNDWNPPSDFYYAQTVARVNALMAANPGFMLKGFLWHQGESDNSAYATYMSKLIPLVDALRANCTGASASTPFIVGGLTSSTTDRSNLNAILMQVPDAIPYSAAAKGDDFTFMDVTTHYDSASLRTFGTRYLAQLPNAVANAPHAPGKVSGLIATPGDTEVFLTWTAPYSHNPVTNYLIERNVNGAGWVTVSHGVSAATTYTDTGRTNGVSVAYRVTGISSLGTGATPSDTASATPAPNGTVYTESFSAYTDGTAQFTAQVDAAYGRQDTQLDVTIATDALAPGGHRFSLTNSSAANTRYLRRDDTLIADGTWGRFQIRARVRVPGTGDRGGIGWGASGTFTGMQLSRGASANDGIIALLNNSDVSVHPSSGILSGLVGTDPYDILIDVASDKRTVKLKAWASGSAEPTTGGVDGNGFQATTTLSADASLSTGLRFFTKVDTNGDYGLRLLWWRLAMDTNALAP